MLKLCRMGWRKSAARIMLLWMGSGRVLISSHVASIVLAAGTRRFNSRKRAQANANRTVQ